MLLGRLLVPVSVLELFLLSCLHLMASITLPLVISSLVHSTASGAGQIVLASLRVLALLLELSPPELFLNILLV